MAIKLARNGTRIAVMSNVDLEKSLQNVRPRKRRFVERELRRRQTAKVSYINDDMVNSIVAGIVEDCDVSKSAS